jgi:hypothetical protein
VAYLGLGHGNPDASLTLYFLLVWYSRQSRFVLLEGRTRGDSAESGLRSGVEAVIRLAEIKATSVARPAMAGGYTRGYGIAMSCEGYQT